MDPIVVEFEVAVPQSRAFEVWTGKPSMWWPRSHTITQDPDVEIVFEPFVGGRIFERSSNGAEHDWGEILIWEPPTRIDYLWHLFFDRAEATEITVTFNEFGGGSLVRLVQTGFERLGEGVGTQRRQRTNEAWSEVTRYYRDLL